MESTVHTHASIRFTLGRKVFDFSERTFIMGVVNVTPDSFADGGRYLDPRAAIDHALRLIDDGADLIDVGGESTRPRGSVYGQGAAPVPADEELRRILPVIEHLAQRSDVPISVDTWKSDVAARALDAGATVINDISGFTFDDDMADTARAKNASVILMHTPAPPWAMPSHIVYEDVVDDVVSALEGSVRRGEHKGISQMFVDPGLGFGKSMAENYRLIAHLDRLQSLHRPIVVGISRKSFVGKVQDLPVEARLEGSLAAMTAAILRGANLIRVHDVKESRRAAAIADELARSW
ncbi:MAG TPA: dihydropteroate synthase [Bacteroidota bacterium]|nr:dihydropteroate synthase [Bacteroidota bacterium]